MIDIAEGYYNLGIALQKNLKLEQAVEAYNMAVSVKPNYTDALYNLGTALKDQGKLKKAIAAYKKTLSIDANYESAEHMLAALSGNTTKTAPQKYIKSLFDGYAAKFEKSLEIDLEYKIPKLTTNILLKINEKKMLGSVIDLGCGTGLMGLELKKYTSNIEGVDLSYKMLEIAKEKKVYNKLIHSEIQDYLSNNRITFDYYIALDVFIYIGDLYEIFRLIKSNNKKPGRLVFSTEHTELDGYHLLKTGRYSHSESYILRLCKEFNYKIVHFSITKLRKEKGRFLDGGIYVLEFTK